MEEWESINTLNPDCESNLRRLIDDELYTKRNTC